MGEPALEYDPPELAGGRALVVSYDWVFFATHAKPNSARRALPARLAAHANAVVVREPISAVREFGKLLSNRPRIVRAPSGGRLVEYHPLHFPTRVPVLGRWIKAYGEARMLQEIKELLPPRTGSAKLVVCYDSPQQFSLVREIGEDVSVYLAIDDRTLTTEGRPIAGELEAERELLGRVDRVVCISEELADTLRMRAPFNKHLPIDVLTNGYDERLFGSYEWTCPAELGEVPNPRILISGHVSERIDWQGIQGAAELDPAWAWVFLGPADHGMAERITSIAQLSGAPMFWFPAVPHEQVPAWVAHCDACAVPYRLNAFTRASSPLKAIEYLAVGAPVLSTEIPSLAPFSGEISWVREGDGRTYASALEKLGRDQRSAEAVRRRQSSVGGHDWASKARRLERLLGAEPSRNAGGGEELGRVV